MIPPGSSAGPRSSNSCARPTAGASTNRPSGSGAPGTEADHIHPWSRGGATELWNGQMLCRRHNRRKSNRVPSPLYHWRLARRRKKY
ncbi:HNH endonuclease [Streptomyces ardesiacus]